MASRKNEPCKIDLSALIFIKTSLRGKNRNRFTDFPWVISIVLILIFHKWIYIAFVANIVYDKNNNGYNCKHILYLVELITYLI